MQPLRDAHSFLCNTHRHLLAFYHAGTRQEEEVVIWVVFQIVHTFIFFYSSLQKYGFFFPLQNLRPKNSVHKKPSSTRRGGKNCS